MNDVFAQWAAQRLREPEISAFCIFHPDQTRFERTLDDQLDPQALDLCWRSLADSLQVLRLNQLPCELFRWVFSQSTIVCARRPDGHTLALLHLHPGREPTPTVAGTLPAALRDFLELAAG